MSTEELLRYDREWEAMRRALDTMRLVFDFQQPDLPAGSSGGDQVCSMPPSLPSKACASTHA